MINIQTAIIVFALVFVLGGIVHVYVNSATFDFLMAEMDWSDENMKEVYRLMDEAVEAKKRYERG